MSPLQPRGAMVGQKAHDSLREYAYGPAMDGGRPYISLKLEVDAPIEVGDFVSAFTSIAAEYNRFARQTQPEADRDATLFVSEVRKGSIVAHLIPWLPLLTGSVEGMSAIITVEDFVRRYGTRLSAYLQPGGRAEDVTRGELKDFGEQVAAIAANPGSNLELAAIEIANGVHKAKAAFKFDTGQAREIQERVAEHRRELEHTERVDHERALMVFTQTNVKSPPLGKRTGELVSIEAISPTARPLIYASDLAEQRIKHEIVQASDNVYKKGFVVDVNVEARGGKPVAYRVTNLHQVIDLPDDE